MSHKPYGVNELREMFLSFFESKGHLRMNSFPLVPQGDNSILLINAGMTPLKKYFPFIVIFLSIHYLGNSVLTFLQNHLPAVADQSQYNIQSGDT